MGNTIPASALVQVNPGVISAGGNALALIGLVVTQNPRVPLGTIPSFPSALSVSQYFGPTATETAVAQSYFSGYINSTAKPAALLFAQYNGSTPVSAYLRGGSIAGLTLAQLQAILGSLTVVVDGMAHVAPSVNLATATSPSAAAALIQTALNATPVTASCTVGSISGNIFTAAGTITGIFSAGMALSGAGIAANTVITGYGTGSGGAGTYTVTNVQTVGTETINAASVNVAVTYDSISGGLVVTSGVTGAVSTVGFATGTISATLFLTSATGAVLSQGADAQTPSGFMNGIVAQTTNWASFMTTFDPDGGSGNAQKMLFATWNGQQNNEYAYLPVDSDITPTLSTNASGSMGQLLMASAISGTCVIYDPSGDILKAAFIAGSIASLDFTRTNGRITFAFKAQSGLVPTVTNATVAANLDANGYNFYGAWATADQNFIGFYPGSVSGLFVWLDSYVNQIWMNANFQLNLMTLLFNMNSVPYDTLGYGLIRSACMPTVQAGLNFGVFAPGVALSALQVAEVNTAAGVPIDSVLSSQGWYLQILPATAAVRAARGSPPCTFWYTDAGAVQKINLASIEVE